MSVRSNNNRETSVQEVKKEETKALDVANFMTFDIRISIVL